eukprot:XP_011605549.1 PREDICTED: uncharacterized protein LOC105416914 [Takifugu rubripes]
MMSGWNSNPLLTRLLQEEITEDTMGMESPRTYVNGGRPPVTFHYTGAVSLLPAAENTSSCNYYQLQNSSQQSSLVQNPNGLQVINESNVYPDSQFINSRPPHSYVQKPNADSLQQSGPVHLNPHGVVQQTPTQYHSSNVTMHNRDVNILRTGDTSMTALMSGAPTTTSLSQQQRVDTCHNRSSLTHNNQNVYSRCNRGNENWQQIYYSQRIQSYIKKLQKHRRDGHCEIRQSQQGVPVSHQGQRTQQHPPPPYTTSHSKEAIKQHDREKILLGMTEDRRSSYPINQVNCSPTNNTSLYRGVQSKMNQPMETNTSNAGQPSMYIPVQSLTESIPVITLKQNMALSSENGSYVRLNLLVVDQNNSSPHSSALDTLPSATEDTCSLSTPPGCTNSRAIAVVQPLSQSCQVFSEQQAVEAVSDKSGATTSCNSPAEVVDKAACTQEFNSRPVDKMFEDQSDAQKSPPSVSRSQSCESSDDPKSSISEISSGLTVSWTIKELQQLIQVEEDAQKRSRDWPVDCFFKVQQLFLDNFRTRPAIDDLLCFVAECQMFLQKHKKTDFVVTQFKPGFENQHEHYHILKDNDLYSETPYRSCWLNNNLQLDDIHKEFDLPSCLRGTGLNSQVDLLATASGAPGQKFSEASEEDLPQTEPKPVESDVKTQVEPKQATSHVGRQVKPKLIKFHVWRPLKPKVMECNAGRKVKPKLVECDVGRKVKPKVMEYDVGTQAKPKLAASDVETQPCSVESSPIQAPSPDNTQASDSDDPFLSFEIQVLPPEEAKLIYEQTESPEHHSDVASIENQEWDHEPVEDACTSVARESPDISDLFNETDDTPDSPIEEVCCLSRLVGNIVESNLPLQKCQCGSKQSVEAVIDLTKDDTSHDSDTETMKSSEKCNCEVIILIENKEDNPCSTDADVSLDPEMDINTIADSVSIQSVSSAGLDSDVEVSSPISEGEENKFSGVSSDSSVETEEQTRVCTTEPRHNCTTGNSENECKSGRRAVSLIKSSLSNLPAEADVAVDPARRKQLKNQKDAQLMLYGSVQQAPVNTGQRERRFSPDGSVCAISKPPDVISVPLRSLKRHLEDPLPVQEQSAKHRIFEIWRKSFPVTPLKQSTKNTQKPVLSAAAKKKMKDSPVTKMRLKLLKSSLRHKNVSKRRNQQHQSRCGPLGDVLETTKAINSDLLGHSSG